MPDGVGTMWLVRDSICVKRVFCGNCIKLKPLK